MRAELMAVLKAGLVTESIITSTENWMTQNEEFYHGANKDY